MFNRIFKLFNFSKTKLTPVKTPYQDIEILKQTVAMIPPIEIKRQLIKLAESNPEYNKVLQQIIFKYLEEHINEFDC